MEDLKSRSLTLNTLTNFSLEELTDLTGGTFAYDVGWAIRWVAYHGPGTGSAQWAAWDIQEAALKAAS